MNKLSKKGLFIKQQKVAEKILVYIHGYYSDYGYSPTYSEIGIQFNQSRQWAAYWLKHLEKNSVVKIDHTKHRCIIIR